MAGPLLTVSEYAIKVIKKMQKENIKSWAPRQDITDQFNEHAQVGITTLETFGGRFADAEHAGMDQAHSVEG